MLKLSFITQPFIVKSMYRLVASLITIVSFLFFQYIGTEYFNINLYSGWIGLIGAITTLTIIRILFGSFKSTMIYDIPVMVIADSSNPISINTPVVENIKPSITPQMALPTFNFTTPSTHPNSSSRRDFNLQNANIQNKSPIKPVTFQRKIQNEEEESIENLLLEKIKLIQVKQEKLEGMKHVINPRVYEVLKRQYALEKEFNLDDLKNEREISVHQVQIRHSLSSQPSALQPEIVSEGTKPIEDGLIERFKKLDKLIATRLERIKARNPPVIVENKDNKESNTIETVV
jgi:hypothetical protein